MNKSKPRIHQPDKSAEKFINQALSFAEINRTSRLFSEAMSTEEVDHAHRFLSEIDKALELIKLTETL